jgi:hypothetical protein
VTMFMTREPTPDEVRRIRDQWKDELVFIPRSNRVPSFSGKSESSRTWEAAIAGPFWAAPARFMLIGVSAYRRAMKLFVRETLHDATVVVGALDTIPDEMLGWAVHRDGTLLYVRVLGIARRRGLGRMLFAATGLPPDCTCMFMTRDGEAFTAALRDASEEGVI